jgi:bacteriorhodopsin
MALVRGRKGTAWLIGSAAIVAEVCAAVAFTFEVRRDVEELTWSLYFWAAGGVMALVALTVSLLSRPRGSDRRPAVFAFLIMAALALIFFAMAGTD